MEPAAPRTNAATRMQAQFRGVKARASPMTLAGRCAILRRELALSGEGARKMEGERGGEEKKCGSDV